MTSCNSKLLSNTAECQWRKNNRNAQNVLVLLTTKQNERLGALFLFLVQWFLSFFLPNLSKANVICFKPP